MKHPVGQAICFAGAVIFAIAAFVEFLRGRDSRGHRYYYVGLAYAGLSAVFGFSAAVLEIWLT